MIRSRWCLTNPCLALPVVVGAVRLPCIDPTALTPPHREKVAERELALLERFAFWLDRRYLDPLIGLLVPGVGDMLGSALGIYSIFVALRLRAHPVVIARMLLNLALDAVLGAIPLLGDVFDVLHRAHRRNLSLLRHRGSGDVQPADWLVVVAAAMAFLLALSLPILIGVAIVRSFG